MYCSVRGSWFGTSWMGALVGAASNKSPISELHFLVCETESTRMSCLRSKVIVCVGECVCISSRSSGSVFTNSGFVVTL